jgi:hypothetical protein
MPPMATWQRPPKWWARAVVAASIAVLPDSARPRYEEEFIADLYGMTRGDQARYSLGTAMHCFALRTAVRTGNHRHPAGGSDMIIRAHRPLRCRLNVRHDWHSESTEDGARFLRCRRCGKDETGPVQKSTDAQVRAHAANLLGSGGAGGGGL